MLDWYWCYVNLFQANLKTPLPFNVEWNNLIQTWFAKPLMWSVTTLALLFKFPRKNDCDVSLQEKKGEKAQQLLKKSQLV